MAEDYSDYRNALGLFATGVTIVTCAPPNGPAIGITVNSFASVSLEPPLVSWCLAKSSRVFEAFLAADNYAVNILRADQEDLSRRFATPGSHDLKGLKTRAGQSGAPILEPSLAAFDCRLENVVDAGDHAILLGQVIDFTAATGGAPLLYYRSDYAIGPDKEN